MAGATMAQVSPSPGGDSLPAADRYRVAVEEYRWQAQFNWSRTQYLLVLNAAILAAAVGLVAALGKLAIVVFALGIVTALVAIPLLRIQHTYYRAARDHMQRIEKEVGMTGERGLDTTSTLGHRRRFLSVNQYVYVILAAIALANGAGILFAVAS